MSILFDLISNNGVGIVTFKVQSFGKKAKVRPSVLAISKGLIDYPGGNI